MQGFSKLDKRVSMKASLQFYQWGVLKKKKGKVGGKGTRTRKRRDEKSPSLKIVKVRDASPPHPTGGQ